MGIFQSINQTKKMEIASRIQITFIIVIAHFVFEICIYITAHNSFEAQYDFLCWR